MKVAELIEKLQRLPSTSKLEMRLAGGDDGKMIMVAEGHELDPLFQFYKPTVCGYGPMR